MRMRMNDEPAPGSFEDFLWNYEVDFLGVEGMADADTRARLYEEWKKGDTSANRPAGAAKAVKTKAKNAKKGISQKGLTGSTKQKQWAAEIRGGMIAGFSEENRKFFENEQISAKFWIDNRNWSGNHLSEKMDGIYATLTAALKARETYAAEHETPDGILVTGELDALRNAVTRANRAWFAFLDGAQ